jgi:hypothetical protein
MKLAVSSLPVILIVAISIGAQVPKRSYLIPDKTEGKIYIFYGVPKGEPVDRSIDTTTFRIPKNRFLVSQWDADPSWHTSVFYYVDKSGRMIPLESEPSSVNRTIENLKNKNPFAHVLRSVKSWWVNLPCEIVYEEFFVGSRARILNETQKERDREYKRFQEFVEKHVDMLCEGRPNVQNTLFKKPESQFLLSESRPVS